MNDGSVVSILVGLGAVAAALVVVAMIWTTRHGSGGLVFEPEPVPIAYLQVPLAERSQSGYSIRPASTDLVRTPSPTSLGGRLAQVEPPSRQPDAVVDLRVDVATSPDAMVVHTSEAVMFGSVRRLQPYEPDPELLAHLDDLLAEASFVHYERLRR